jgi:hypothetical protein
MNRYIEPIPQECPIRVRDEINVRVFGARIVAILDPRSVWTWSTRQ